MPPQIFSGSITETEYSGLLEALSSTSKGRAFLDEYRRRSQPQDTLTLLSSLQRIAATMDGVRDQLRPESIADELRHIAMSLDIAVEGAAADEEGDDKARRFALADRARRELQTLAASLAGGAPEITVVPVGDGAAHGGDGAGPGGTGYRLRDTASDR